MLGKTGHGLEGPVPLSWSELDAFMRIRKLELTPIEADTLITMSRVYCIWSRKTDPHAKSPVKRQNPYAD